MTVFALLSAGGSPGVTTAALALTLGWPSQVILAECDPSGGDVLAGLLGGHMPASTGLLPLALEAGAGAEIPADTLRRQLVELDEERNRLLLAGISDPRQAAALQSSLPWIADALQAIQGDVIADCGRLDSVAAVRPVLSAASLAVLVLRPTLRQVSRALSRVEMLINLVGKGRVVLLTVGEGTSSGREIARTLGVPVAGQLPEDARTASVLSDGTGGRHRLQARPLIRAATTVGHGLREAAAAAGPLLGTSDQPVFSLYTPTHSGPEAQDMSQPGAGYPGLGRAGSAQPGAGYPSLGQPGSGQPGGDFPHLDQAGADRSGSGYSGSGYSGSGYSGSGYSGSGQPGAAQPGSGAGRPGARLPRIGLRGLMPPENPAGRTSPDEVRPDAGQSGSSPYDGPRHGGSPLDGPPDNGSPFDGFPYNSPLFDGSPDKRPPVNGTPYDGITNGHAADGYPASDHPASDHPASDHPANGRPRNGGPRHGAKPVNGTHYGDASHGNAQNGSRP